MLVARPRHTLIDLVVVLSIISALTTILYAEAACSLQVLVKTGITRRERDRETCIDLDLDHYTFMFAFTFMFRFIVTFTCYMFSYHRLGRSGVGGSHSCMRSAACSSAFLM